MSSPTTAATTAWQTAPLLVQGVELECLRAGQGAPLLVLHDQEYLNTEWPYLDALAEHFEVLVPSHPGFGRSALPEHFDALDDLVYVYLDLLRALERRLVRLAGFGFGGWIAAEMAVRCTHDVDRLLLVDAVGIKVSEPTTRDVADNFVLDAEALLEATWHDPGLGARTMKLPGPKVPEDDLIALLRNRQAAALFGWKPFMHNPKLRARLRRIDVPTLVAWGESDRLVSADYGRAFAAEIPGATFELIPNAGHFPYLEQPDAFVQRVLPFLSR